MRNRSGFVLTKETVLLRFSSFNKSRRIGSVAACIATVKVLYFPSLVSYASVAMLLLVATCVVAKAY